ncbi:MAG: hypothetical protein WCG51_02590, partial [Elusimicrobiota bacterium]
MKGELVYVVSYLPENIEKMETHPDRESYNSPLMGTVHSALQVVAGKRFLAFIDSASFFYQVDYAENKMRLFAGGDLPCAEKDEITDFGGTFYADDNDADYFYFSACGTVNGRKSLHLYRSRLDLSELEKVSSIVPYTGGIAPHVTRKHGTLLLNSLFFNSEFRIDSTGRCFDSEGLMRYVYEDLYKEFCATRNRVFSQDDFIRNNAIRNMMVRLEPEFGQFCQGKGKNFTELSRAIEKYRFTALPGR